ncbi:MAG: ABC transporter ATP-binding protein [Myxococcales bacterium]|nr:ABC transporter ATP-binding protein [Myxococcales bacterium]
MSNDIAIRTEGLGKCYRVGEASDLTLSFREAAMGRLWGQLRRFVPSIGGNAHAAVERELFWALRNFDLEVKKGEVIGILGRNGAGKSTLLKVLSRITAPTEGRAEIHGRVGSLLEVGTGFHLELTGRENVFLNGAILGMRKAEIKARFDEIVDFSEIGTFIDTPVKRYSSGMRMRLGFVVAAFLEPEILFIDEVLAVGDAEFRRKCMGKMDSIAGEGRTILFVSHNMSAISNLCTRAILIEDGRCVLSGEPQGVIQDYLDRSAAESSELTPGSFDLSARKNAWSGPDLIIRKLELLDAEMNPRSSFAMGEKLFVRVHLEGMSASKGASVSLIVKDGNDRWLCDLNTAMSCSGIKEPRSWSEIATLEIDRIPFVPGRYPLAISVASVGTKGRLDYVDRAAVLEVTDADVYDSGYSLSRSKGVLYLEGRWSIEGAQDDEPSSE